MNIPMSGTNSLITLPASAPFTLYGMKKKNNKKKEQKKTFVTSKDIFNWNRKLAQGKEKPPKPSCKKDSEYQEYEEDQEL